MVLALIEEYFFSFPSGGFGCNVIVFGVDMSSSAYIDNKKKGIIIPGKGPTQGLGEHSLTAEKMYSINFIVTRKNFCLSLHYNGLNSYLFLNDSEIIKFKAKDSEIVASLLCLGNISKDWSADNMKKAGFNGYVYDVSVDYDATVPDIIKNLNVKVFNLMSRTTEARHIERQETCNCKCRLDGSVSDNKQRWNDDKFRCECKELIDKELCDRGFIWNPSNCECECDKPYDVGEYLDYENCKCRKRLFDNWLKSVLKLLKK